MKAVWKNIVLAESNDTKVVEDQHYFPPDSINSEFFHLSDTRKSNSRNGKASYFHIKAGDELNPDSAWFYPHPKEGASAIKNYVAFSKGIEIKN